MLSLAIPVMPRVLRPGAPHALRTKPHRDQAFEHDGGWA